MLLMGTTCLGACHWATGDYLQDSDMPLASMSFFVGQMRIATTRWSCFCMPCIVTDQACPILYFPAKLEPAKTWLQVARGSPAQLPAIAPGPAGARTPLVSTPLLLFSTKSVSQVSYYLVSFHSPDMEFFHRGKCFTVWRPVFTHARLCSLRQGYNYFQDQPDIQPVHEA